MKKLLAVPLIAFASTASADQIDRVKVYDHTKTIYQESPVVQTRCDEVKVPIYQQVQTQGDAAGGALAGMIIGGILGKGVTGKDDGAAAGAIIGGLVGADKGSKPKTTNQIIGYELRTKCIAILQFVSISMANDMWCHFRNK